MNYFLWTTNKKTFRHLMAKPEANNPAPGLVRRVYHGNPVPKIDDEVRFNNFDQVFYITEATLISENKRFSEYTIRLRPDEIYDHYAENLTTLSILIDDIYSSPVSFTESDDDARRSQRTLGMVIHRLYAELVDRYSYLDYNLTAIAEDYFSEIIPRCFEGKSDIYMIFDDENYNDFVAMAIITKVPVRGGIRIDPDYVVFNDTGHDAKRCRRAAELLIQAMLDDHQDSCSIYSFDVSNRYVHYFDAAIAWFA